MNAASMVFPAILAMGSVAALAEAVAQEAADIAYVEEVTGQVMAYSHGTQIPLEKFVVISDRTRLVLGAESELRICHYGVNRVVTLSGPMQAVVSKDGVIAGNGRVGHETQIKCAPPSKSKKSGGVMMRGKPKARPPQ